MHFKVLRGHTSKTEQSVETVYNNFWRKSAPAGSSCCISLKCWKGECCVFKKEDFLLEFKQTKCKKNEVDGVYIFPFLNLKNKQKEEFKYIFF